MNEKALTDVLMHVRNNPVGDVGPKAIYPDKVETKCSHPEIIVAIGYAYDRSYIDGKFDPRNPQRPAFYYRLTTYGEDYLDGRDAA